jgi:hypothetical protein
MDIGWARRGAAVVAALGAVHCSTQVQPPRDVLADAWSILEDNGDPHGGYGVSVLSELDAPHQIADGFTLQSPATVTGVQWWGRGEDHDGLVRLFRRVGGHPRSAPAHEFDAEPDSEFAQNFDGTIFRRYTAQIPPTELEAGSYLLSIVDRSARTRWGWAASCEDGCPNGSYDRPGDHARWRPAPFDFAFRLLGCSAPPKRRLLCHCLPGTAQRCYTLELTARAARAHFEHHPGDYPCACTDRRPHGSAAD